MHVTFSNPKFPGPLADAEIHFTEGPLAGFKMEGFGIRRSREHGIFATVPSRPYTDKATGEKRFWELVRFDGKGDQKDAFKNWLVAEYEKTFNAKSEEVPF